jgi:hypothetical protein
MLEALGENPSMLARGIARFGGPAFAETLSNLGSIAGGIGTVVGIVGGIASVFQSAGLSKEAKSQDAKLKHLKDMMDKANKLAEEQNKKENGVLTTIREEDESINVSLKSIQATEKLNANQTHQLLKSSEQMNKAENTHTDQLKQIIKDNRGEHEAQQHAQVKLDRELQALESEAQKEVNELARISTVLDRPSTVFDFRKDLQSFETVAAQLDYVSENYSTFINMNSRDIDSVLDVLIDKGALTLVH